MNGRLRVVETTPPSTCVGYHKTIYTLRAQQQHQSLGLKLESLILFTELLLSPVKHVKKAGNMHTKAVEICGGCDEMNEATDAAVWLHI